MSSLTAYASTPSEGHTYNTGLEVITELRKWWDEEIAPDIARGVAEGSYRFFFQPSPPSAYESGKSVVVAMYDADPDRRYGARTAARFEQHEGRPYEVVVEQGLNSIRKNAKVQPVSQGLGFGVDECWRASISRRVVDSMGGQKQKVEFLIQKALPWTDRDMQLAKELVRGSVPPPRPGIDPQGKILAQMGRSGPCRVEAAGGGRNPLAFPIVSP